jgi:dTDP-4-amino-4,6-dideoxygalactose transaminase
MTEPITFNRPTFDGREMQLIAEALANAHISGSGPFTREAESILSSMHGGASVLLTPSCTSALEMSFLLSGVGPGDEVIVPAFTFVSTANAVVMNGAKPVFADVNPKTLNIDYESVTGLITDRTRAVCIVHYGGAPADPMRFSDLADRSGLALIEDNAHGLGGMSRGKTLGTFGAMSTLSFHETKNIICGEGGALVLNDNRLVERAEIIREKGTDRSRFFRGLVDKYRWVDVGSSWVMSDLLAAVLVGQLERFDQIQAQRRLIWDSYAQALAPWAVDQGIETSWDGHGEEHTSHLFFLNMPGLDERTRFIGHMERHGILAVFHYQALNTSPQGLRLGGVPGSCPVAEAASDRIVRLPLFAAMTNAEVDRVISAVCSFRVRQ